jgi:hypothetical protein
MRLYGEIQKVEPQDDGTVRVHGIATSEAVDDQGEIVRSDAMRAAIPEYMRFPALREMHQLSAAGTTLEAEVCEDGTTRIVAHVVDPIAVAKVKNQVYRGFSIGGRVTQREAGNPKTITSLVLNEISLVDRPANPEAVFDCWKAAGVSEASLEGSDVSGALQEPFNAPIQIWACGLSDHCHITKADAFKCLEKRASASPGPKTAVAVASVAVIEPESAASAAQNCAPVEVAGVTSDERDRGPGAARIAALLHESKHHMQQRAADLLAKAKHSQSDQVLLDMAQLACDKCLKVGSLSADERENLEKARDHLHKAGALQAEEPMSDISSGIEDPLGRACPPNDGGRVYMTKALDVIAATLGKAGRIQQHLMVFAHGCLSELTDRVVCGEATKVGARHSKETMEHFEAAHMRLVAAGANCGAAFDMPTAEGQPDTGPTPAKTAAPLVKALTGEHTERAALVKVLDEIVPMLERLTKRVDDIARTPLPPLTMAKGTVSVSKQQGRGSAMDGAPELSPEAIAAALAKMSKEEQTLTLIKASYANPIRVGAAVAGEPKIIRGNS